MKKTLGSFIAAAALSGTIGANVQAEEVTIKKGDTLWNLARVHNTTIDEIKAVNNLDSDTIHSGATLTIPEEIVYKVVKGDSLWKISRENGTTVEELMKMNGLKSELIIPGMELKVKNIKASPAANPTPVKTAEKASVTTAAPAASEVKATSVNNAASKELVVTATAYTASCEGCSGVTATGIDLKANPDAKVISVDPSVIPLGSKVYVEGYGHAIAGDTGGAIKGNKIDIFIPSYDDAIKWGSKQVKVTILN